MKLKNLTLFTLAVALLSTAARTASLLYTTESSTGFFISRLSTLGVMLSVLILILTVIAAVFAFFAKEKAISPFKPSSLSGIFAVLLGISFLLYSFGLGAHTYLIPWQHTLETVTGILSGAWFIAFGLGAFMNIKLPKIAAILPCIHSVMRLVVVFTSLSTSALVAEHVFSLAYHASVMVYMLNFGRFAANEPSKNGSKFFFPITVTAFIFTATSVFSRLIVSLSGKPELIHGEVEIDITGIVLTVFMLLCAADICKENNEIKEADSDAVQR